MFSQFLKYILLTGRAIAVDVFKFNLLLKVVRSCVYHEINLISPLSGYTGHITLLSLAHDTCYCDG